MDQFPQYKGVTPGLDHRGAQGTANVRAVYTYSESPSRQTMLGPNVGILAPLCYSARL